MIPKTLEGINLGFLTFIKEAKRSDTGRRQGLFRCECGNEVVKQFKSVKALTLTLKACGHECPYWGIKDKDADIEKIKAIGKRTMDAKARREARELNDGVFRERIDVNHDNIPTVKKVKKSSITIDHMSELVRLTACTAWR